MGAFATLRHFDELAHRIAAVTDVSGEGKFQVLSFDHRGIGRSTIENSTMRTSAQTSEILAKDAMNLIDHTWKSLSSGTLHIYGASMGGMVAQKLALLLIEREKANPVSPLRLRSLYLAVTARSYGLARFIPIGPSFYRFIFPWILSGDPQVMVESLLDKCFSKDYLDSQYTGTSTASTNGQTSSTIRELWKRRWVEEYSDWFSLHDLDATAAQATVAGRHRLTDSEAALLRESGVHIFVAVAEKDELISPADQFSLAELLQAGTYISKSGHMGSAADYSAFCDSIIKHFSTAIGDVC